MESHHKRSEELYKYHILDTPPEREFDDITETVAHLCQVPICIVTILDRDNSRFFFKSHYGYDANEFSFTKDDEHSIMCLRCINQRAPMLIEDFLEDEDPEIRANKYAIGSPYLRFYAASPLQTALGLVVGTLCVMDYVPRKLTEAQLKVLDCMGRQVATQLELRRKNAESAIIQERLVATNTRLQELDNQRLRFIGMISHDIRQSVCTVQVSSELLLSDKNLLTEEQRELAESGLNAAEYMSHLLDDLLEITNPQKSTRDDTRRIADPMPLIKRTVLANTRLSARKDITLTLNATDEVEQGVQLRINVSRIERVLNNLISNAIKFSLPNTNILVNVKRDEHFLVIDVIDEGQGIPESDLPHVFEGLRTISVKPTANEKSSGLGLTIAKQLVDQHGGSISVQSVVNKGSTFTVRLPIVVGQMDSKSDSTIPQLRHSLRILLAEDNLVNQKLLKTALSKRGHEVICVNDGLTAVEIFKKESFHVVLLDNQMPIMDGGTAAKFIREINPKTPLISISGSDVLNGPTASLFCTVLSKPFDLKSLYNTIESVRDAGMAWLGSTNF